MRVHVSLRVGQLEDSVRFYSALFGVAPTERRDDYANFRLDQPPIHLALVEGAAASPVGGHHGIELEAGDELRRWLDRARGAGIETRSEEAATCCYAVADKFWATDPDGNRWET